ncbi:MAG: HDOD domain-containing protein [Phycisphaerales bacterium]|nr:HDOD domain-containing protein [Phycisphaerales bacterium]
MMESNTATSGALARRAIPKHIPLNQVLARINEISTLPHLALRVMQVANDPEAGAAELKNVVEADAALSARVLRSVNSSAYALQTKITNLHYAISYLGFNQIRNLAVTALVSEAFKLRGTIGRYDRAELWRHIVSVGICARMLAARKRIPNYEDAYLAGLLHDFGIILEDQHLHDSFEAMIIALDGTRSLSELEEEYLGFNHSTIGLWMGKNWKFPPAVQSSIQYHHASHKCTNEHVPIVQCVEIADFICSFKGITSVGINLVPPPKDTIMAMELTKDDLKVLITDLDTEILRYESLFKV